MALSELETNRLQMFRAEAAAKRAAQAQQTQVRPAAAAQPSGPNVYTSVPDKKEVSQYVSDLQFNQMRGGTGAQVAARNKMAGLRARFGDARTGFGNKDARVQKLLDAGGDVADRRNLTIKQRASAMKGIDDMLARITGKKTSDEGLRSTLLNRQRDVPDVSFPTVVNPGQGRSLGAFQGYNTSSGLDDEEY